MNIKLRGFFFVQEFVKCPIYAAGTSALVKQGVQHCLHRHIKIQQGAHYCINFASAISSILSKVKYWICSLKSV